MDVLRFLLNVVWLVLCGFWMALGYAIAGIICCILIITIPFGIASFRIAGYVLWPFGRTTRERADAGGASCVGNVIWLIFAGWWLALGHLATSIALAITREAQLGVTMGHPELERLISGSLEALEPRAQ